MIIRLPYEACVWPLRPDSPDAAEVAAWLDALAPGERMDLGGLLRGAQLGGYSEAAVLEDWVEEHGGRRWYRWVMWPRYVPEV